MLKKILIILFCFVNLNHALCQDELIKVKLSKNDKCNAPLLVSKLTKGKTSDKEKFDAIFYWVAHNINYDANYFYTEYEYGPEVIEGILKNRRTICLGYSQLMDSLCKLANIKNVTVFGFAKDWLYDVGDSLFLHNHAWNAVKLDDSWYLYDVTWSNGYNEVIYSGKSKWILRLLDKFPEKYKRKTLKVPRKMRKRLLCKKIEPIVYYKRRYFNTVVRNWLQRFVIMPRRYYRKGVIKDYYLSNPSVFAATHVPDDPIWSLTGRKSISEFENDSLSYYLTDSILKHQTMEGTACIECDDYIESSYQTRLNLINQRSAQFNPKNKFINTFCYSELGKIHFYKSLNADSSSKISVADSSVSDFTNEFVSVKDARNNIIRYFKFHKAKNNKKNNLLLKENATHLKFVRSKVKLTIYENRRVREVGNKSVAFARVYIRNRNRFRSYRTKYHFEKYKPYADARINELNKTHSKKMAQYDSLNSHITKNAARFDSIAEHLSLNIWPVVLTHDSIYKPFLDCIKLRRSFLDNYKKPIVDLRRKIPVMEYKYSKEIDVNIYQPINEFVKLFTAITRDVKMRQTLMSDLLKVKLELVKAKEYSETELNDFKSTAVNQCQDDFCWLTVSYPKTETIDYGLAELRRKQDLGRLIIAVENSTERSRHSMVNKYLKLGYKGSNQEMASTVNRVKRKNKEINNYRKEISVPQNINGKRYNTIVKRLQKMLRSNRNVK